MSKVISSAKFGFGSAIGRDAYKEAKESVMFLMIILLFFGVIFLGFYFFFYALIFTWNVVAKSSSFLKRILSLPMAIILTPIGTLITAAGLSILVYVIGGLLYGLLTILGYNIAPTYASAMVFLEESYTYISDSMLVSYLANQLEGLFLIVAPASVDMSSNVLREFLKLSSMTYLFISIPTLVSSLIFTFIVNEDSNTVLDDQTEEQINEIVEENPN